MLKKSPLWFLLICLSCMPLYSAKKADFRKGIKSQEDWIARYKENFDYRIFYLLAARSGRIIDTAKSKEVSEALKANPDQVDPVFKQWGIIFDEKEFYKMHSEEWKKIHGNSAFLYESKYYHILSTKKQAVMTKNLGFYMDKIYGRYLKKFNVEEDIKGKFYIKIFPNRNAYLAYGAPDFSRAYFLNYKKELVSYFNDRLSANKWQQQLDELISSFFHEGFHQFMGYFVPNAPMWLNEGLCEHFEASLISGKGIIEGKNTVNGNDVKAIREIIKRKAHPSLKDVMHYNREQFYSNPQVHYPQAYSIIHFFAYGPGKNQKYFKDLVSHLRNGMDREEAMAKVFEKVNWDKFEVNWKSHVKKMKGSRKKNTYPR